MDITCLDFAFPKLNKIKCTFQTRLSGYGTAPYDYGNISLSVGDDQDFVSSNRKALLKYCKLETFSELLQVHGDEMLFEPNNAKITEGATEKADGFATSKLNQGLLIKTADCQPILIAHKSQKYICALHVGWRGNRIHFIQKAIKEFCKYYSIEAKDLSAVRGPSLGLAEFINFEAEWGSDYTKYYDFDTKIMNLWLLTKHQLQEAGLEEANIFSLDLCTYRFNNMFFSHRKNNKAGRQASLIWIEE